MDELPGKKQNIMRFAVIGGIALAVLVCAAAVFSGPILKRSDPKRYIASAFKKTFGEINKSEPIDLLGLLNGKWRQDVSLNINKIEQNVFEIDPMILTMAEVMTLRSVTYKDTPARLLDTRLTLRMAVTSLVDLNIFARPDYLAVTVPQILDYSITADPKQIVTEWDASIGADYLGIIGSHYEDEFIYKIYEAALFMTDLELPDFTEYKQAAENFYNEAEIVYEGKKQAHMNKNEPNSDLYSVTFSKDALNNLLKSFFEEHEEIDASVSLLVYISGGKIAQLDIGIETEKDGEELRVMIVACFNGNKIRLSETEIMIGLTYGDKIYSAKISSESELSNTNAANVSTKISADTGDGTVYINWDFSWDKNETGGLKCSFEFDGNESVYKFSADGILIIDAAEMLIEADIKNLQIYVDTPDLKIDADFSVRYSIQPDDGQIIFEGKTVPLTSLNEFDLLEAFGSIMESPQLGMLFGGLLF
ncbi:MAG: hypothetical protein FWE82_04565 [Defluviitaleaceae bacterium]|nr:hypothetical protein [Defluviitaleaceae bacterium]